MFDSGEECMTGKYMSDIIVAKIKSEYEKCILRKNTVAVNSEVILDSHSLVASTLKE